jgi:hypothetical protein
MKKQLFLRMLFGAPIGLASSTMITIVISLILGDGTYYAVVPSLVRDMGSEINAVILQAVLSMLYGAAWAGASVIWSMEKWSILKMTLVHLAVTSLATLPVAYFAQWMPHSVSGVLIYFGIFFAIYLGVWLSQYAVMKKRVNELNRKIRQ